MTKTNSFRAYGDLTMAMIIVGSSVVAGKYMIIELPVFLASALRFASASLLVVPLLLILEGWPRLSRRSWLILAIQALCGTFLFNAFLLYGLKLTSAAAAGVITSTTPAFMGLMAYTFLRQRLTPRAVAGIALSVGGVMAINLASLGAQGQATHFVWGNLLVLGAVAAESVFLLLRKMIPEPLSPLAVSTLMTLMGLVFFTPPALIQAMDFDFISVRWASWLTVGYYGVFITVAAYLFWFSGVTKVPADIAGVFTAVMPLSAVGLSSLLLGERLHAGHIIGTALVLTGIWSISQGPKDLGPTRQRGA